MKTFKGTFKPPKFYFQMTEAQHGDTLICPICNHQWQSSTSAYYFFCPNCFKATDKDRNLPFIKNYTAWFKTYVRSLTVKAIREGCIEKKTICEECGKSPLKIAHHHENYLKPFELQDRY